MDVQSPEPRVTAIESASASTACQTNRSNFAYWLCAGVLGLIAVISFAIALLIYAAFATIYYEAVPGDAECLDYYLDDTPEDPFYEDPCFGDGPQGDIGDEGADEWMPGAGCEHLA